MHLSLFQILFFTSEATNVLHESSHCFHAPVFFNCTSDFVFMLLWCFSLALTLRSLWNLLPGVFNATFLQLTLLPLFPFLHPSQFEHCILWKLQCDHFFWLGFLFNYSTLSYSHDCFTRPFFLPTNASFVFASFDFFFIRVSQSSVLLFLYLPLLLTWPLNPPALPRFQHQFKLLSQIHSHHRTSTIFGRRLEAVSVAQS